MTRSRISPARRGQALVGLGLVLVLTSYLGITLSILGRQDMHWDEHHDLMVASSYLGSPRALLAGSRIVCEYLGIGPSAVSTVAGRRTKNVPETGRYIELISKGESAVCETEDLSEKSLTNEAIALRLRAKLNAPSTP